MFPGSYFAPNPQKLSSNCPYGIAQFAASIQKKAPEKSRFNY
jgi:hypothetical protein